MHVMRYCLSLLTICVVLALGNWSEAAGPRIAAGSSHTVAIKSDGTLWAWGSNVSGQLGDGTTANRSVPTQIGSATNWNVIAAGEAHNVAIRSDGTLWAWGSNVSGQLGDGTTTTRATPIQVGAATNWSAVAAGDTHTVAVRTDGTLWAWGSNVSGQLGDGTIVNKTVPTQIGTVTNWSTAAAGSAHTVAIRTDGTLWAWGSNASGQLGDGTTANKTVPAQVGGAATWNAVDAGSGYSVATGSDGTLWAWGANASGQLGDGTIVNKTVPTQIGSGVIWSTVTAGSIHTMAIRSDGTLWAWGSNVSGQLGDGTTVNRTVPTQIASGFSVPLQVISTVPANGAKEVSLDTVIQAVFNHTMDATTITTDTFTVSGGVTGTIEFNSSTNTATFTPSAPLDSSGTYTATITTGVRDSSGTSLPANFSWSFTTDPEDKGEGGCFIATAAYGSYLDPHVQVLRNFRDRYLATNRIGRYLVSSYYQYSPPVARLIESHGCLRTAVRWALTPLVYGLEQPFLIVIGLFLGIAIIRKRRRAGS
ncbi:MAG: Regulator of chromosome condensation (RCC1) repeat protein [Syntrophorhabdaceae bacterium PtaU1.Bin034]|nr:MAG: Regulator of chromosome condensation (RCC1) repeat protein [Syntrophorhabdaceae bacterium PtaU1.Bin034]